MNKYSVNYFDLIIKDKDWSDGAVDFWKKTLLSGKKIYVIKYGIIWGCYMSFGFISFMLIYRYVDPNPHHTSVHGLVVSSVLGYMLGGILYSYISWVKNNNSYKKYKDNLRNST